MSSPNDPRWYQWDLFRPFYNAIRALQLFTDTGIVNSTFYRSLLDPRVPVPGSITDPRTAVPGASQDTSLNPDFDHNALVRALRSLDNPAPSTSGTTAPLQTEPVSPLQVDDVSLDGIVADEIGSDEDTTVTAVPQDVPDAANIREETTPQDTPEAVAPELIPTVPDPPAVDASGDNTNAPPTAEVVDNATVPPPATVNLAASTEEIPINDTADPPLNTVNPTAPLLPCNCGPPDPLPPNMVSEDSKSTTFVPDSEGEDTLNNDEPISFRPFSALNGNRKTNCATVTSETISVSDLTDGDELEILPSTSGTQHVYGKRHGTFYSDSDDSESVVSDDKDSDYAPSAEKRRKKSSPKRRSQPSKKPSSKKKSSKNKNKKDKKKDKSDKKEKSDKKNKSDKKDKSEEQAKPENKKPRQRKSHPKKSKPKASVPVTAAQADDAPASSPQAASASAPSASSAASASASDPILPNRDSTHRERKVVRVNPVGFEPNEARGAPSPVHSSD